MQTHSFHLQTPLFQGFPLPKRKQKEEFWVSSSTEVPVFAVETPSQMLPISFGEGDKGGEDQQLSLCKRWGIIQHLITNNRYDCLLELIQKLMGDQAFGTYLNDFYAGNQNANFPTFLAHTRNRLELSELYIYGSGRLGNLEQNLILHAGAEQQVVWNPFIEDPSHLADSLLDEHESIASTPEIYTTSATHKSFIIGQKRYEISNHLGNVSSVITDRKFGVPLSSTDPTISYYLADIVTATDYDPYGQALPGRVWNRTGYRFGFNGKETDPEWEIQDYGFRLYDPSIGRFISIDPLSSDFPWWTPYQFAGCEPIANSDLDGLEPKNETGEKSPEQFKEGDIVQAPERKPDGSTGNFLLWVKKDNSWQKYTPPNGSDNTRVMAFSEGNNRIQYQFKKDGDDWVMDENGAIEDKDPYMPGINGAAPFNTYNAILRAKYIFEVRKLTPYYSNGLKNPNIDDAISILDKGANKRFNLKTKTRNSSIAGGKEMLDVLDGEPKNVGPFRKKDGKIAVRKFHTTRRPMNIMTGLGLGLGLWGLYQSTVRIINAENPVEETVIVGGGMANAYLYMSITAPIAGKIGAAVTLCTANPLIGIMVAGVFQFSWGVMGSYLGELVTKQAIDISTTK